MDKFKIGDVVYHKAGDELLGTICEVKEKTVVVRIVKTLFQQEMYPDELKLEAEVEQEREAYYAKVARMNEQNRRNWDI